MKIQMCCKLVKTSPSHLYVGYVCSTYVYIHIYGTYIWNNLFMGHTYTSETHVVHILFVLIKLLIFLEIRRSEMYAKITQIS